MDKITKETSPFKANTLVALIRYSFRGPRRIAKKTVERVHGNGRFILAGSPGVVYTPKKSIKDIYGHSKEFRHEHVELWTPEIEKEIESRKREEELITKRNDISPLSAKLCPIDDAQKIALLHYILKEVDDDLSAPLLDYAKKLKGSQNEQA